MVDEESSRKEAPVMWVILTVLLMAILVVMAYFAYQVFFLPGFRLGGMAHLS